MSWTGKRTNESILSELNTKRLLSHEIDIRRLKYVEHAAHHKKTLLMSAVLMGRVEGKKKTGKACKESAQQSY